MALKFQLDTIEGVPEAIASEYKLSDDGKYYLDVEGVVAKTKLNEFRETNVNLMKELESYKTKYTGIDPEEYTKLKETFEQTKDKALVDPKEVEELNRLREEIELLKNSPDNNASEIKKLSKQLKALEEAKKSSETTLAEQLAALKQEKESIAKDYSSIANQLNAIRIESAVKEAAIASGVAPGGLEDVLLRARAHLTIVDGNPVVLDADGTPKLASNGIDNMSINEWMSGLKKTATHLFLQPRGAGAQQANSFTPDTAHKSPLDLVSAALSGR